MFVASGKTIITGCGNDRTDCSGRAGADVEYTGVLVELDGVRPNATVERRRLIYFRVSEYLMIRCILASASGLLSWLTRLWLSCRKLRGNAGGCN